MNKRYDWITPAKKLLQAICPDRVPSWDEVKKVAKLLQEEDKIMQEIPFDAR